ncbi:PepSY-like domain-containing protein [Aequorivita echinoideorum]|uniref:PepSY-like domain-containing protein n=1 Tax=Aequorivita echinoideorum TaxID=1549647 RepID=A0ABS5S7H2_9FLAO|nr:PepSY-like domain-containing protein [Aequorivita echinoideorum]MBT0608370.1 PepSY-like domain-containing protein [Aequorivita echinoideorum]
MKNVKILSALFLMTNIALAQDIAMDAVHTNVKVSFNKEYANATAVEWERDMENYKVEFDLNQIDTEVWYSDAGNVIRKEQDIAENELPQAVRNAIKSKYASYRVDEIEKIWQNNLTSYEVELEKNGKEMHINFDDNAKVLNERMD